jgi:hypothetical protein
MLAFGPILILRKHAPLNLLHMQYNGLFEMGNNADQKSLFITDEMCTRRKLKGLFARDAMQPLIDGSTKEQVSSTNENTDFF